MSIALNLKMLRTEKQLSQKDMAELLNINLRTYASYERGEREPSAAIILNICKAFNISSDVILKGTDFLHQAVQSTDKPYIIELRAVDELPDDTPDKAESSSAPSDDDIKFALFDGSEGVTDEMYDEVKRFAKYIKEQKEKK